MKKNIIKKSIIITVVILITISAPLGTYHIGQQNAYGYNKTELFMRISAAIMYGVTTVQAGITNSSIGEAIESKETEIQSLVDNYVEYMMEPYQKLKIGMITDRADLIPEIDKDTYLQEFDNIPEFDALTNLQKENAWLESREILADGIVTPREMLQGTGIHEIYENAIKIAIDDLKKNVEEGNSVFNAVSWTNYPILSNEQINQAGLEIYPYQTIIGKIDTEEPRLIASKTPIIISFTAAGTPKFYNSDDEFKYANLNLDSWDGIYNMASYDYFSGIIYESNYDIYENDGTLYFSKNVFEIYTPEQFQQDLEILEDIPVQNSILNPDFDRDTNPVPLIQDTTQTPDASISVDYDPDTGDTNISQLSDSLGLLGDTYLEGANQITGEIEQTNTLLDRILGLLQGIKSNTDTGTIENPTVDTDIKGVIDGKLNIQFMKDSYNRLQSIDTTKGTPPVIYINLAQMFTAGTSQIAPGIGNPFENRDYIFIDFGYLDSQDLTFLDYTIIDYFRFLLGMGMIYTTALYLWRKIIPDKVVN
jgi:hypothetical protein